MNQKARLLLGVLAMAMAVASLALAGCSSADSSEDKGSDVMHAGATVEFPITVTDDAGRLVTISEEPQRIVSLAPANTEIVAALGLLDRLVGVTTFCDYPPEVADLPKIGDFVAPNMEAIAVAEPDLILATTGVQAETIEQLEQLGAAVVAVDPQTLEAVFAAIVTVGDATGASAKAEEIVTSMRSDLADISAAVEVEDPSTCFLEIAQDPLFTAGSGTLLDDLVSAAGGVNVVSAEGYVGYSLEQLLDDDPDVYLATKGSMSDPSAIDARPGFDTLKAVRDGQVYVLDDNLVSRPGPRVVDGVRQIAEALHPGTL